MIKRVRGVVAAIATVPVLLAADVLPEIALLREANTTLQFPPAPPLRRLENVDAFPGQSFSNPLAITSPAGETDRIFIVEKRGRIIGLKNLTDPERFTFLDISGKTLTNGEEGLLGLAFHPNYAQNGFFFVFYTTTSSTAGSSGRHDRLARYRRSAENPDQADVDSEIIFLDQRDHASNHNGGDIHFGPDGYLYVALGDEGGGNDSHQNGQRLDKDFFAGILRIDVDRRAGSLDPNPHPAVPDPPPYGIPPDNPFIGLTSFNGKAVDPNVIHTEFWAVGLRNPWRMSFDLPTGRLYVGDVGQDAKEEIDLIERGGNYGWPFKEGTRNTQKANAAPEGFVQIDPLLEYFHPNSQFEGPLEFRGNSVTGGVVYRGDRISELQGAYIFADYARGNVWSLKHEEGSDREWRRLFSDNNIAGFGIDPSNGDVLMADLSTGPIKRLQATIQVDEGSPLPRTLSNTGAFSDLENLTPHAGIVPYAINLPFWSDNALKTRWFSLPDPQTTMEFRAVGNWSFPPGSVWIKHFDLELINGDPGSARRVETRFLVKMDSGIYGMTYRWEEDQTLARLVVDEGMDEDFVITDGDQQRTQTWHYPSRNECLICHTKAAGYVLGFDTTQLNREITYPGAAQATHQITALQQAGYLAEDPGITVALPSLAALNDTLTSREHRVRSYLEVNCAQCHQPEGPVPNGFDARAETPTSLAGLINGVLNDDQGDAANRIIVPGDEGHSMLLSRISQTTGRMPPLASNEFDQQAIDLIRAWIMEDLPVYQTYADWAETIFGVNGELSGPREDADLDLANNELEFLTNTSPQDSEDAWDFRVQRIAQDRIRLSFLRLANRGFEIQVNSDLTQPGLWVTLNHPDNQPIFTAADQQFELEEMIQETETRFYRVRVFTP